MNKGLLSYLCCGLCWAACLPTVSSAFEKSVTPLIEASCIDCHDADTKTPLNFEVLNHDLSDPENFRAWEKVFDQIQSGEMPPKKKARPDVALKKTASDSLYRNLRSESLVQQKENGRVPVRRLTRTEYEYTLHDLLSIGGELAKLLPPEKVSSTFDTVAIDQGISPVHIRAYLAAADAALQEAIELGPQPRSEPYEMDYQNNSYVQMWFRRELRRGGNTVLRTDDAFVTFDGRPHTTQSNNVGFQFPVAGKYLIKAEAYAYQASTPVTFCLYRSSDISGNSELIGTWQLDPGQPKQVEVIAYFIPGDFFYLSLEDDDWEAPGRNVFMKGARNYRGEGLAVKSLSVQGPIEKQWPPERTRKLLGDVEYKKVASRGPGYKIELSQKPLQQVREVIGWLGPRAYRRPLKGSESEALATMAKPVLEEGRGFESALKVSLRAMFSSPEFLYQFSNPGKLDDYALATRLSYFLWKSLPDDQLTLLASEGELSDPEILSSEIDRMLDDEKSQRFISDFLGQWLELYDIDATTPDEKLYPEYDDVLRQAMIEETELFFSDLVWNDHSVSRLIDSDYTFVNRRLAEHYGISGVEGLEFRKVSLPANDPRGGLLTQASILKVTANGTNTSPVPRGNFVLSKLLGTPPPKPPAGVESIEPDTRGTTTIREELAAHRSVASCASCHQHIDPPGFALESFDPIGGFRNRYRTTGKGDRPSRKLFGRPIREYRLGQKVDSSGTTSEGGAFSGIREFKQHLLTKEDQIARNFIRQLITYSTGAEIQFADREELERIYKQARANDYGVRGMIHEIVQSQMFRNK